MKTLQNFILESQSFDDVISFLEKNDVHIIEKHYHDYSFENISNIDGKEVWICKNVKDDRSLDTWKLKNVITDKLEPIKITCYIPKTTKEKEQLNFCAFGLKTDDGKIITTLVQKYNGWKGNNLLFADSEEECNKLFK